MLNSLVLVSLCSYAASCASTAHFVVPPSDVWERALLPVMSTQIDVELLDTTHARGHLAHVDAFGLTVVTPDRSPRTINRFSVKTIRIVWQERDSVMNGALLGAAFGALGMGLYLGGVKRAGDLAEGPLPWIVMMPVGAAGGAGIGAIIDALHTERDRIVYSVQRP